MLSMRILIIIGHGGNDKGAISGNFIEGDMNITTGVAMYDYLKAQGFINVSIDSRDTDVNKEVNLVNSGNYDLVISIHFNAGGGDGFECFYYSTDSRAKELCLKIEKQVKAIGQNSRGVKTGDGFAIIRKVTPTSIILEGGFIDNATDRTLFDSNEELKRFGIAYAKGLMEYLGVKEVEPAQPSNEKLYRVQVGAFKEFNNAKKLVDELKGKGYNCFII